MNEFSFSVFQDVSFGNGILEKIGTLIEHGPDKKILLVSDKGLEKLGLVERVKRHIEKAGYSVICFCEIETNPDSVSVYAGAEEYQKNNCETIVALGGGSPMDVSKAIAIIAQYGGRIQDYEGAKGVPGELPPMIAIPTTAGTGSEVTAFSVITDHKDNFKYSLISDYLKPKKVLLDPQLITSLPPQVAAFTGVDAFIHGMETYLSLASNPFSGALALQGMQLIGKYLRRFVANRNDLEAASNMLIASTLTGIAFSHSRLGNIHAMSHPLSAHFNTAHGVTNAALMLTILRFNKNSSREKYRDIYNCLAIKQKEATEFEPDMLIDEVEKLLSDIFLPTSLAELDGFKDGISDEVLDILVEDTMKSGNVYTNPTTATRQDIKKLYLEALGTLL